MPTFEADDEPFFCSLRGKDNLKITYMSLDEEFEGKNKEFYTICKKYEDTMYFKDFYDETEQFRNNPELLDNDSRCTLYYNLGLHFTQDGENHLEAISFFKEALKNLNKEDPTHKPLISEIKSLIGFAYSFSGEEYKNQAIEAFKESYFLNTYSMFISFDYVFSYRNVNKFLLQDLINNELTVVSPSLFNDPVDSPFFSIIRKNKIDSDNTPIEIAASYFKVRCFVSNISVNGRQREKESCLVEEYKNFLMWSHYADSHKGVCIKYKLLGEFSNGNLDSHVASHLVDVTYENSFEHKKCLKLSLTEAFATKNSCWSYENEVRLIHYDPNCNSPIKALPLGKNGNVEAVYFGLKCPPKDIETIRGILTEDVAYFQMKEDDEDIFKLVEVPLNQKAEALLAAAAVAVNEGVTVG
jgi:hypothetical protein